VPGGGSGGGWDLLRALHQFTLSRGPLSLLCGGGAGRRPPPVDQDAQEQSVVLITIHAAQGLEWPIVIPFKSAL
jgi:hypothetical protein